LEMLTPRSLVLPGRSSRKRCAVTGSLAPSAVAGECGTTPADTQ